MAHRGDFTPVALAAATSVCGSRVRGPPGLCGSRRTCRRRIQRARRSARTTPGHGCDPETEKGKRPKGDEDDEMKLLTRKINEMDSSITLLVKQVADNVKKVETITEYMRAETKLRDENRSETLAPIKEPEDAQAQAAFSCAATAPNGLFNEPGMTAKEPLESLQIKSRDDRSEDDLKKLLGYANELNSKALESVAEVADSLESLRNEVEFRHRMSDAIGSKLMEVLPRLKDTSGQLDLLNERVDHLEEKHKLNKKRVDNLAKGLIDHHGLEKKLEVVSDYVWKKFDFFERNELLARVTERVYHELEDYINRRMEELKA